MVSGDVSGASSGGATVSGQFPVNHLWARHGGGRLHLEVHVLALVLRVAGEPGPLHLGEVDDAADLRRSAGDSRADGQRGIGAQVLEGDDDARVPDGWMSMRTPYVRPLRTWSEIAMTLPSTGA